MFPQARRRFGPRAGAGDNPRPGPRGWPAAHAHTDTPWRKEERPDAHAGCPTSPTALRTPEADVVGAGDGHRPGGRRRVRGRGRRRVGAPRRHADARRGRRRRRRGSRGHRLRRRRAPHLRGAGRPPARLAAHGPLLQDRPVRPGQGTGREGAGGRPGPRHHAGAGRVAHHRYGPDRPHAPGGGDGRRGGQTAWPGRRRRPRQEDRHQPHPGQPARTRQGAPPVLPGHERTEVQRTLRRAARPGHPPGPRPQGLAPVCPQGPDGTGRAGGPSAGPGPGHAQRRTQGDHHRRPGRYRVSECPAGPEGRCRASPVRPGHQGRRHQGHH